MSSTFNHINASEQLLFGSLTTPILAENSVTPSKLGLLAFVIIQDITYTAVNGGVSGNNITISYVENGIAGFETVNVVGQAITVHIGNHTVLGSTATQVLAALNNFPAALLLISPIISGTPSNIQLATSPTNLIGGGNSSIVNFIHSDSNVNLTGNVQLVSGSHITLSQVGQAITIAATGELSMDLTNSHIFVGNASNVATDVALSGDATIANTGVLTLENTSVTSGSYTNTNLTVDSKGRITSASNGSVVSPGGSNTSIQFNNSDTFGGDNFITYNGSQITLNVIDNFGGLHVLGRSGGEASIAIQPDTISDGSAGQWVLYTNGTQLSDPNDFAIYNSASGSPAFNIQASTSFIGIGQQNPQHLLDVNGRIHTSNNLLVDGEILSDSYTSRTGDVSIFPISDSFTGIRFEKANQSLIATIDTNNSLFDMRDNPIVNVRTVIFTNINSDPISPVAGQVWFRSDLQQLFMYNGSTTVILG